MVRVLDAHPWIVPRTASEACRLYRTLAPFRDTAERVAGADRIASLVPLRVTVFLDHWTRAPREIEVEAFIEDARGLIEHDVPRLRETLLWAPVSLPDQRAPRLGVATLNTVE